MTTLSCPEEPSLTGAYRVSWQSEGDAPTAYRLTENGAPLYEGPDVATTVTGRPEGRYEYALFTGGGAPAASCVVEVRPPPMSQALGLMSVGALVFLSTLVLVVFGHRAHRRALRAGPEGDT